MENISDVEKVGQYVIKHDEKGNKEVVWSNTNIDKPTWKDIKVAVEKEFPGIPDEKLGFLSGIMSLTIKVGHSIL